MLYFWLHPPTKQNEAALRGQEKQDRTRCKNAALLDALRTTKQNDDAAICLARCSTAGDKNSEEYLFAPEERKLSLSKAGAACTRSKFMCADVAPSSVSTTKKNRKYKRSEFTWSAVSPFKK